MKGKCSVHNCCNFTKVTFLLSIRELGKFYCWASVLWYVCTLSPVWKWHESFQRPDAQFGKVGVSQELTSPTISSFQFCSQKAITENKNHSLLQCVTENITGHLHVGGSELSQLVQKTSPWGALGSLHAAKQERSPADFSSDTFLTSLEKVSCV